MFLSPLFAIAVAVVVVVVNLFDNFICLYVYMCLLLTAESELFLLQSC